MLSGFKDGKYELRLKNFCTEADALADASIHEYVSEQKLLLTVDTVAPVITRTFNNQQYFGVEFVENIDCSDVKVEVTKRYDACSKTRTSMNEVVDVTVPPYEIRCFNTTSQGTFSIKFADADVGQYKIIVRGIKDGAGISAVPVDGWFIKCRRNTPSAAARAAASARLSRAPTRANDAPSSFDAWPFDHLSEPAAVPTGVRLTAVLCAVCVGAFAVIRLASSVGARREVFSLDSTIERERDDENEEDECAELRPPHRASYGSII